MADIITITGLVATAPRHVITAEGLAITSFRLASSQRRSDRANQKWIDGDTNWYSITAFRQLAVNAAGSVSKGDRIIVTARLRVRARDSGEKQGVNVDVEADALGHDLTWGTSQFSRTIASSAANAEWARPMRSWSSSTVVATNRTAPFTTPTPTPSDAVCSSA